MNRQGHATDGEKELCGSPGTARRLVLTRTETTAEGRRRKRLQDVEKDTRRGKSVCGESLTGRNDARGDGRLDEAGVQDRR